MNIYIYLYEYIYKLAKNYKYAESTTWPFNAHKNAHKHTSMITLA